MTGLPLQQPLSPSHLLVHAGWLFSACMVGMVVATQPLPILVIVLAVTIFVAAATFTPLAAVIVLLILSPMRTLIATEAPLKLPLDIGQITLLSVLAFWAIYRIVRGQRIVINLRSPITTALVLYIIIIGLTAFNAVSLGAWFNDWLKWVQIFLLIIFAINFATAERWQWLLFGMVLAGAANALVGIFEFFGGSGALHLLINNRFFRAFGTFGQPNPFGGFMGLLLPLAIMAAVGYTLRCYYHQKDNKLLLNGTLAGFYAMASILMLAGIGMSWSRGAWIGLGGALLAMVLALPRRIWKSLLLFIGIVVAVIFLWTARLLPPSVVDRLATSTQEFFAFDDVRGIDITPENYAVAERLAHWQAALNMASASPWLGIGVGNYEVVYPDYRLINWLEPLGHAHNYYLNILAEAGIIGLLGYGKVWLIIIWMTWRTRAHPDQLARFTAIGSLGSWIYLSIHSIFDNLYVNNLFLHMGLMIGLVIVLYNQTRNRVKVIVNESV